MLHKIETIEKEINSLKLSILKGLSPSQKKVVKLKGILKGIEITEAEISSAQRNPGDVGSQSAFSLVPARRPHTSQMHEERF